MSVVYVLFAIQSICILCELIDPIDGIDHQHGYCLRRQCLCRLVQILHVLLQSDAPILLFLVFCKLVIEIITIPILTNR